MSLLNFNEGKNTIIKIDGIYYARFPIKTHVITEQDNIADIVDRYVSKHIEKDDILFISEKSVACCQGRAIPLIAIHPRKLAYFLSRFVYKSPNGIGLGIPETMEMAISECGTLRIIFAAFISLIGKILGKRGWFYKIAGVYVSSIDGPTPYTIPPYNKHVVLSPLQPNKIAQEIADYLGVSCVIVDINDLGGKILGTSNINIDQDLIIQILKDNPLGQGNQSTPMGIIRQINKI